MKKVLVTGCSGYIGRHLIQALSHKNYEVCGIDFQKTQQLMSKFFCDDIRSEIYLNEEFHTVIHLAALVSVSESKKDPLNYYSTNFQGTLNILHKIKTTNFIFASTGAAEKCETPYGVSKRASEDVIKQLCPIRDITYTIFRFYNVIGTNGFLPTNESGVYYNLIKAAEHTKTFSIFGSDYNTKDGTCVRDYVHVSEICNALLLAIDVPANSTENLGHGVGYTVNELAETFKRVNEVDFNIKFKPRRTGDTEFSVSTTKSSYIQTPYTIEELLKI
jgi:UDP-glucose 4-epimerase